MKPQNSKSIKEKARPLIDYFCNKNGVKFESLSARTKDKNINLTRYLIMFYLKEYSPWTNAKVASVFNVHHSACSRAKDKVKESGVEIYNEEVFNIIDSIFSKKS